MNNQAMQEISKTAKRLYEAADKLRDVRGPSAVGRLLGVSPQVIKNWELREVSEGGALLAQRHIGCDANWVLGLHETMVKQTKSPALQAQELARVYQVTPSTWPFTRITPEEWRQLDAGQKEDAESLLRIHLNGVQGPARKTA